MGTASELEAKHSGCSKCGSKQQAVLKSVTVTGKLQLANDVVCPGGRNSMALCDPCIAVTPHLD